MEIHPFSTEPWLLEGQGSSWITLWEKRRVGMEHDPSFYRSKLTTLNQPPTHHVFRTSFSFQWKRVLVLSDHAPGKWQNQKNKQLETQKWDFGKMIFSLCTLKVLDPRPLKQSIPWGIQTKLTLPNASKISRQTAPTWNPNFMHFSREIGQNYHRFASSDPPKYLSHLMTFLVDGFNPSQVGSFPQFSGWKWKHIWNHHPVFGWNLQQVAGIWNRALASFASWIQPWKRWGKAVG